jgi:hypothetical protein
MALVVLVWMPDITQLFQFLTKNRHLMLHTSTCSRKYPISHSVRLVYLIIFVMCNKSEEKNLARNFHFVYDRMLRCIRYDIQ